MKGLQGSFIQIIESALIDKDVRTSMFPIKFDSNKLKLKHLKTCVELHPITSGILNASGAKQSGASIVPRVYLFLPGLQVIRVLIFTWSSSKPSVYIHRLFERLEHSM